MKNLACILACLFGMVIFGQTTNSSDQINDREIVEVVDTQATFPEGNDAFTQLIYKKFDPSEIHCGNNGLQDSVIKFVVEKDGTLNDITATGSNERLNREFVRIVKSITQKWQPASIKGKNVSMQFRLPIRFICE